MSSVGMAGLELIQLSQSGEGLTLVLEWCALFGKVKY